MPADTHKIKKCVVFRLYAKCKCIKTTDAIIVESY